MGGERSKKNKKSSEMRRNYEALRGVEGRRLSRKGNAEALGIKKQKTFCQDARPSWTWHIRLLRFFLRGLNSFGMAWCVHYGSGVHGSLGSDG